LKENFGTLTSSNPVGSCRSDGTINADFFTFSGISEEILDYMLDEHRSASSNMVDITGFIKESEYRLTGTYNPTSGPRLPKQLRSHTYPPLTKVENLTDPIVFTMRGM